MDASTTTVGYAFVDGKEIVTMGFIPIQKEETIRDKVELTMKEITTIDPFNKVEQKLPPTLVCPKVKTKYFEGAIDNTDWGR